MKRSFWKPVIRIAREEWRMMWRDRIAAVAICIALLLALAATLAGLDRKNAINRDRAQVQAVADQQWQAQPDRHPHRVVHYGHYVFRPLSPLAFFDFGVDPFTGHTLYLEGHRQNTANFSDARQSSVLMRFGFLTPAFVLQTLLPLLIVFLAFGSVARERERGQLRMILMQGASVRQFLVGKLAGHAGVAFLLASPALIALAAIAVTTEDARVQAMLMFAGYAAYLFLWCGLAVLGSALVKTARDALIALVGLWMFSAILLPRILPDIAAVRIPLPTRIEADVSLRKALAAIGESHNPNDPYFAEFRSRTLAAYKVTKIEDLPVNYGGLLMQEGERLTSELFNQAMQADFARQASQSRLVNAFSLLSPVIALRQTSMALAGTDRDSHQQFLAQAEAYRYGLIQALNRLHAEQVRYQNDRDQRVSHRHWQDLPRFAFEPPNAASYFKASVLPGLAALVGWLAFLILCGRALEKRLGRAGA